MKITFEGDMAAIIAEMREIFGGLNGTAVPANAKAVPTPVPAPTFEPVAEAAPVDIALAPVDKPIKPVHPQIEKMRAAKAAKAAERKAAKLEVPEEEEEEAPQQADPADAVRLRQRTIEDLQAAYAGGAQQQVFELLSRFGNGAKSFRELPPEAFIPIRAAIDNGALT